MKQRVIAILMIIPLVLMLCVFSAANVVTLAMPVPVSGLELDMRPEEVVSLSAGEGTLQIRAHAVPVNAQNGELSYRALPVEGKRFAEVEIGPDGLLAAKRVGTAKIEVSTAEGGFTKSFLLEVTSEKATELELFVEERMTTGERAAFSCKVYPEAALDRNVVWSSSAPEVLSVQPQSGEARAVSAGTATVTAEVTDALGGPLRASAQVTVTAAMTDSGLSVDGSERAEVRTAGDTAGFRMEMNTEEFAAAGGSATPADVRWSAEAGVASVEFGNETNSGRGLYSFDVTVTLAADAPEVTEICFYIDKPEYGPERAAYVTVHRIGPGDAELILHNFRSYLQDGSYFVAGVSTDPAIEGAEFACSVSDPDVVSVTANAKEQTFLFRAKAAGSTEVVFRFLLGGVELASETRTLEVIELPAERLNFLLNAETHGIADEYVFGSLAVFGTPNANGTNMAPGAGTGAASLPLQFTNDAVGAEDVRFEVSDGSVASVSASGRLTVKRAGTVTVTAVLKAGELLGKEIRDSVTIRCVEGINAETYPELRFAAESGARIVLQSDIDLGVELVKRDASGAVTWVHPQAEQILAEEVGTFATTAPWNYYRNRLGYTEPPELCYALRLTNDLYGNGFVLNADNITNLRDSTGALYPWAKFRGPLDFVSLSESGAAASVKAQDNAAFLVQGEGIEINNAELRGADIAGGTESDWSDLNYVGTTVEAMGKVAFRNCRITTGRTVLRVFGETYEPAADAAGNLARAGAAPVTEVSVESCILTHAREFLLRVGTNVRQLGDYPPGDTEHMGSVMTDELWELCAPEIAGYRAFNSRGGDWSALTEAAKEDEAFCSLIKTDVTVRDSVFYHSGLFSIGLESSFAGPALDGGRWNSWNFYDFGWRELAATSFPTRLAFEGDVRIYDWKDIRNIDSSTLIEDPNGFHGGMLKFDIAEFIEVLAEEPEYADIVANIGGETFAHGGIAMYGGGKNYCLLDLSGMTSERPSCYAVGLTDLNNYLTNLLTYAAGREPFRFFMYGAGSRFDYARQTADIASGIAFSVPPCKS